MLKLKCPLPDVLPFGAEALLEALDQSVPRECIQPGQDMGEALFQSGARALVDLLITRFELAKKPENDEPAERAWYGSDTNLKSFIEGDW